MSEQRIERIFNRTVSNKAVHEGVLLVESSDKSFYYSAEYGGKGVDSPLLIASITKLFTTASILILQEQGKLSLEDKLSTYIPREKLVGLHKYKGQDYTDSLKLSSLLFQTSGLPDIFEEGKQPIKHKVIQSDMTMTFDEKLLLTKEMSTHFPPDSRRQAHYADINFDLLGEVIETVTQMPLHEAYQTLIFQPLGLTKTYLPVSDEDVVPRIYYKATAINRPRYIQCCRASGGAISTATELMRFTKAFFSGELFNRAIFQQLSHYNRLQMNMFPIQYGGGYMRIPLNSIFTLFSGKGELIGHSGSSGSFAYYYAEKDLYLVGDLNQLAAPALPIRLMMQIVTSFK